MVSAGVTAVDEGESSQDRDVGAKITDSASKLHPDGGLDGEVGDMGAEAMTRRQWGGE